MTPDILKKKKFKEKQNTEDAIKRAVNLGNSLFQQNCEFSFFSIQCSQEQLKLYLGLNKYSFLTLCEVYKEKFETELAVDLFLPRREQLLMTIMLLRMNLPLLDLSHRFGCSLEYAKTVIINSIHRLQKLFVRDSKTDPFSSFDYHSQFDSVKDKKLNLNSYSVTTIEEDSYNPVNSIVFGHFKCILASLPNGSVLFATDLIDLNSMFKILAKSNLFSCESNILECDNWAHVKELLPPSVIFDFSFTKSVLTRKKGKISQQCFKNNAIKTIKVLKEFTILQKIPFVLKDIKNEIWHVCCGLISLSHGS